MILLYVLGGAFWISLAVVVGLGIGRGIRKANHHATSMFVRSRVKKLNVNEQFKQLVSQFDGEVR